MKKQHLMPLLILSATMLLSACGSPSGTSSSSSLSQTSSSSAESSTEKDANSFEVSKHYDNDNKDEIPADAVNQVMFAYSDAVDVTFSAKLTLDEAKGTYELYKQILAYGEIVDGEKSANCNAEYIFQGAYEKNGNDLTLKVPTGGKASIYYPTVLNYQSIEKQTQGWVSFDENPTYKTRFNDWYPAKLDEAKDQNVTIKGDTIEFEAHEIKTEDDPKPTEEKVAKVVVEGSSGGSLSFFEDFTYAWTRSAGGRELSEEGTWVINESNLIVLTFNENVTTGTLDAENAQTIEYTPYSLGGYAEQMKETFVLPVTQWGQLTLIK